MASRPISLNRFARQPTRPLPVLIIMHGEASSAGRIGLGLQRRGHALDIRKPRFGCGLPETLENHAGVVVFGGPMSCNDPDDYLRREIDFAGLALKQNTPFLGICLGAQMLAKCLGAKVTKHPAGRVEIGYHRLSATSQGAALGPWPDWVYQWHREGFELPASCRLLATGEVFENQAFKYGEMGLGLQFHPEINYALVNRWTNYAKDWKGKDGAQDRTTQLEAHLLGAPAVARWLDPMLGAWLDARIPVA